MAMADYAQEEQELIKRTVEDLRPRTLEELRDRYSGRQRAVEQLIEETIEDLTPPVLTMETWAEFEERQRRYKERYG